MDNKEQQLGEDLRSDFIKITNYFRNQKLLYPDENSWRKDIVSRDTGVSIQIINRLIEEKKLSETADGRISDSSLIRSRIGNEQRRNLINSLAYQVKDLPRRNYGTSKLVEDLKEKNRGFSR